MTDFVRARSEEQKQARMAEIKAAADSLFNSVPYQEITLSTIAGKLSWTRANLYKYVTTKEEIYLEICSDKMHSYFDDLFAAFPEGKTWTPDEWAGRWADVLNDHRDYFRYAISSAQSSRSMSLPAGLPALKKVILPAKMLSSDLWQTTSVSLTMTPAKFFSPSCTMRPVSVGALTRIRS